MPTGNETDVGVAESVMGWLELDLQKRRIKMIVEPLMSPEDAEFPRFRSVRQLGICEMHAGAEERICR